MKNTLNSPTPLLRAFVEGLPERFDHDGEVLHDGRNTIRAFDTHEGRYVVKKYKRPGLFNRIVYTFFRKSKARRAYEHALRLRALGIDSPEPLAWAETRHSGLLADAWFVSRYTDYIPLCDATRRFPEPDTLTLLTAFARFAATLHEKGILHEDFNHSNILYRIDPLSGEYRFQLIDVNRMKFRRHVGERASIVNLRRLSCPGAAYLFVLETYSEARGWNVSDTLLRGAVFRLLFGRRQRWKAELKRHRAVSRQKKQG